jgi:hypothetical protein
MFKIIKLEELPNVSNHGNLLEYTPVITDCEPIIILESWWNKIYDRLRKKIISEFGKVIIKDFDLPRTFEPNELFWRFYNLYRYEYKIENWMHLKPDIKIVNIPKIDIESLKDLNKILICSTRNIKKRDVDEFSNKFILDIENVLKYYSSDGAFVKLSSKSGKNHIFLHPCFNFINVLENIVGSPEILKHLDDQDVHLIFQNWKSDICKDNEFRVIIVDKQVRFISQQIWFSKINLQHTPEYIIEKILSYYEQNKSKIIYNDCVLDVYVTDECNLIEINCGGHWSCAGSALFDWHDLIRCKDNLFIYCAITN